MRLIDSGEDVAVKKDASLYTHSIWAYSLYKLTRTTILGHRTTVIKAHSSSKCVYYACPLPRIMDTFERIALDAASLSISHTATSASASTVGLGYVSGRVIMALGDFALRGVGRVNIEIRLRRIASRIRTERPELWSRAMIEELIERQRLSHFPTSCRN